jgi:hypothetical protein
MSTTSFDDISHCLATLMRVKACVGVASTSSRTMPKRCFESGKLLARISRSRKLVGSLPRGLPTLIAAKHNVARPHHVRSIARSSPETIRGPPTTSKAPSRKPPRRSRLPRNCVFVSSVRLHSPSLRFVFLRPRERERERERERDASGKRQ